MQDLDYQGSGALGLAATWPQGACCLPGPSSEFDWEGDEPLNLPMEELVIYEMHVRGFTWDRSSGVSNPGAGPAKAPARHTAPGEVWECVLILVPAPQGRTEVW